MDYLDILVVLVVQAVLVVLVVHAVLVVQAVLAVLVVLVVGAVVFFVYFCGNNLTLKTFCYVSERYLCEASRGSQEEIG